MHHPRIYNLTKIHLESSPSIVKHPSDSWLYGCIVINIIWWSYNHFVPGYIPPPLPPPHPPPPPTKTDMRSNKFTTTFKLGCLSQTHCCHSVPLLSRHWLTNGLLVMKASYTPWMKNMFEKKIMCIKFLCFYSSCELLIMFSDDPWG